MATRRLLTFGRKTETQKKKLTFDMFRRKRVRGEDKYLLSPQSKGVLARKEGCNDEFVQGTFRETTKYMRTEYPHVRCENVAEMTRFLQDNAKEKVVRTRDGRIGVELLDHDADDFRFKRGLYSGVGTHEFTAVTADDLMSEVFQNKMEQAGVKGGRTE